MNKQVSRLLRPSSVWYCAVMLLFCAAAVAADQYYLAAGELALTILVFSISRIRFARRRQLLMEYVQNATDAVGISVHAGSPFPMAVIRLPDNEIIWGNPGFYSITGLSDTDRYQTMDRILPGFSTNWLREGRSELPGDQLICGRRYRIYGNYVKSEDEQTTVMLATIFFADMTEMFNVRDEFLRTRPIVSLLLIDNHDELTSNLTDAAVSKLDAQIYEAISKWTADLHAICRKTERNRYLLIFESKDLGKLQEEKFSILESIRSVTNPAGVAATISLGIGKDGASFEENYSFATLSVEMSLSRGGDQAVIKDRFNFTFFGGKTKETERHTRVKSRVVAGSLAELINQSSQVFIMGHRMADLDALGAAVGLSCLCRKRAKPVKIVLDQQNNAVGSLLQILKASPDFEATFISGQDALVEADSKSLLIVVDTNRPDQVEYRELLESIHRVAVIDHHRRAADYIEQVVLNLHEPFASSASELVAELLQYAVDAKDIRPIEAQALLAGIVLDTKNFSVRTGARTFESAAFLRRTGADPVEVKKLFQSDLDATLLRYQIVQAARLYRNEIAIASIDRRVTRTIAAQAADELLNISGIQTSFVLYPADNQVIISARSIGSCNVQVILEKLGGGGNAATAGAQIRDKAMRDVLTELVASIDSFYG
ncbi:MAG: DHH family phosphoesterase [Clostridia bacterium]|nr:DHH family phosphoesterase [Clostridia bacterium]